MGERATRREVINIFIWFFRPRLGNGLESNLNSSFHSVGSHCGFHLHKFARIASHYLGILRWAKTSEKKRRRTLGPPP